MKSSLLLVVLVLFFLSARSHSKDTVCFVLGVEKEYATCKKTFIFKPHSHLKIKTGNGIKYSSDNYSFSDKFIVMDMKDTILFDNILWIKGKVYDDKGRKIAGTSIVLCAFSAGYFTAFIVAFGGGPFFLAATPFIGAIYGGLSLAGARKFWKMNHCYVLRINQSTHQ